MDNKIPAKRVRKTGFTLIELLVTIAILSIIFVACFLTINGLFGNSEDKVNKITKKMIINAAEQYAIEFKDSVDWEEEKESGKVTFCVSLDSLINYGYFKQNDEKVKKYRNDYIVKMNVVNGVIDYKLVEKTSPEANSCVYYENDVDIDRLNGDFFVMEDGKTEQLGKINYSLVKEDELSYNLSLNYNMEFEIDELVVEVPTYVFLVMDNSGSMLNYNRYINARTAAIELSSEIVNNIDNAMVSLIQYDYYPFEQVSFVNTALVEGNFKIPEFSSSSLGNTNTSGGLDLVSSIIYRGKNSNTIDDNSNIYTILLYDGGPHSFSYLYYPVYYDEYNYYQIQIYPRIFYDDNEKNYYLNSFYDDHKRYINCSHESSEECIKSLEKSALLLKGLNSKLIVVGYEFANEYEQQKMIASDDSELCSDSSFPGYCYYDSDSSNIVSLFDNISSRVIEKVRSTEVKKMKIILKPSQYDGKNVFSIYENDVQIEQIEQELDFSGLNEIASLVGNDEYEIKINYELFNDCEESDCKIENVNLFDVEIFLDYDDNTKDKTIAVSDVPTINLSSKMILTVN